VVLLTTSKLNIITKSALIIRAIEEGQQGQIATMQTKTFSGPRF